jgi:hypothetical protein
MATYADLSKRLDFVEISTREPFGRVWQVLTRMLELPERSARRIGYRQD